MLKKEITYEDLFDETTKTETHYFNLTRAELIEFDADYPPLGAFKYLSNMTEDPANNTGKIIAAFKDLILRSYGVRTPDGRFVKSQELRDAFAATDAYSALFLEITQNEEAAAAFINGVAPKPDKNPQAVAPALG